MWETPGPAALPRAEYKVCPLKGRGGLTGIRSLKKCRDNKGTNGLKSTEESSHY